MRQYTREYFLAKKEADHMLRVLADLERLTEEAERRLADAERRLAVESRRIIDTTIPEPPIAPDDTQPTKPAPVPAEEIPPIVGNFWYGHAVGIYHLAGLPCLEHKEVSRSAPNAIVLSTTPDAGIKYEPCPYCFPGATRR
jgi:hypothetical protein